MDVAYNILITFCNRSLLFISGNHELRLPKEYAELKVMLSKLKNLLTYTTKGILLSMSRFYKI